MLKNTNLQDLNFNELYKEQKQATTFKAKGASDWDKKADEMNERVKKSNYNDDFFNYVDLKNCETLLDVGCGVGNLSIKFAPHIKEVFAFDYSDRMLELVDINSKEANISNIQTFKQDIEKSWDLPKADVVIASRSIGVVELEEILKKLNNHALKRVYVTVMVGGSFVSDEILQVLDTEVTPKPDYIYLVNILHSLGVYAKVNFIDTEARKGEFYEVAEFIKAVEWSLGFVSEQDKKNLEEYFYTLPLNEKNQRVSPNPTKWAVVSWEKNKDI